MLEIICHSWLNTSNKLLLLYFSEVKEYNGTYRELGEKLGMCLETVSKGCKLLEDEGFIWQDSNRCKNGLLVRYLDK